MGKTFTGKLCTLLRQQVHCTVSASTLLTSGVIPSLKPLKLAIAVSGFKSSNSGQKQQKGQPYNWWVVLSSQPRQKDRSR
jgi:hypothetical protein